LEWLLAIYTKGCTGQPNLGLARAPYSKEIKMNAINKTARIAGFLYFMYFVTSVIANMFGNFVFVDASATLNTIIAHESQFRIGLVISLFSVVFFILAAWYLYVLLLSFS
jgi:hypothetical protein